MSITEFTYSTDHGTITTLNPNIDDILAEIPTEDILPILDYYEVKEWVAQQEREKAEADE